MTAQEIKLALKKEMAIQGNYVYYPIEFIEKLIESRIKNELDIDYFLIRAGISKSAFYADNRRMHLMDVRFAVVKVMRERGYSFYNIANKLNKNHSSIMRLYRSFVPYNEKKVQEYVNLLNQI